MSLSLVLALVKMAALLLVVVVVAVTLPRWLIGAWVFSVLVLPLIRIQSVGVPIYLMDVLGGLLLLQMLARGASLSARRIWPWHWLLIGLGLFSTVAGGAFFFGFHAEQVWIWGHYSLSCLPFLFAVTVRNDPRSFYTKPLEIGLVASLLALGCIGVVQYFDLPGKAELRDFFYGGFDSGTGDVSARVEQMWRNQETQVTRVPGPVFSPGGFGGTTLLGFLALLVIQRGRYNAATWLGAAGMAAVALVSVSRLVMISTGIGTVVLLMLGNGKERRQALTLLSVFGIVFATLLEAYFGHAWSERFARLEGGMLQDENVAARVIAGPSRLLNFFIAHPEALILGAGLDPEKLASRTRQDVGFETGFVSNSFLLSLYYMGFSGFLFYTLYWCAVLRSSFKAPRAFRGAFIAVAAVCVIIIGADNYALVFEAASSVLNLIAGLILSEAAANQPKRRSALQPAPTIDAPAAPLPAR